MSLPMLAWMICTAESPFEVHVNTVIQLMWEVNAKVKKLKLNISEES